MITLKKRNFDIETILLDYNDCRFMKKHFLNKKKFEGATFNYLDTMDFFKLNIYFSVLYYVMSIILLGTFLSTLFYQKFTTHRLENLLIIQAFLGCMDIDTCVRSARQYIIFSDLFKTYSKAILYFSLGFAIILALLGLTFFSLFY